MINNQHIPIMENEILIVYDNSEVPFERLNKEIIEIVEKKYKSLNLDVNIKKSVELPGFF